MTKLWNDDEVSKRFGSELRTTLWYPGVDSPDVLDTVYVSLCHVRASDGIRITYDLARDGWVICQPEPRLENEDDSGEWVEVAFIKSWQLEEP